DAVRRLRAAESMRVAWARRNAVRQEGGGLALTPARRCLAAAQRRMARCRYAYGIGGFGDLGESDALASSHTGRRRVEGSAHEMRGIAGLGGPPGMGSSHRLHRCRWGVF